MFWGLHILICFVIIEVEKDFLIEKINTDWFGLNFYFLMSLGKHNFKFKSQNRS